MEKKTTSVFGGSNPVRCHVLLDENGVHSGTLELTHEYGVIPIPVMVIKNGDGPTVFLSSGCHGDEYEGQLVVRHIIHNLELNSISGRLIILPSLNYPAVQAGTRNSPLDQGNLNRSFPGTPDAGPTAAIADYITKELLPLCDAGIDLHSGGRGGYFLPVGFVCTTSDMQLFDRVLEMSHCFETRHIAVCDCGVPANGLDGVAHEIGIPFISAELGGGGTSVTEVVEVGINSVRNLLAYLGVLKHRQVRQNREHIYLDMISGYAHVMANRDGIYRTFIDVGDRVEKGQLMALLYSLDDVETDPVELKAPITGIVVTRRALSRASRGEYIFTVASTTDKEGIRQIACAGSILPDHA